MSPPLPCMTVFRHPLSWVSCLGHVQSFPHKERQDAVFESVARTRPPQSDSSIPHPPVTLQSLTLFSRSMSKVLTNELTSSHNTSVLLALTRIRHSDQSLCSAALPLAPALSLSLSLSLLLSRALVAALSARRLLSPHCARDRRYQRETELWSLKAAP